MKARALVLQARGTNRDFDVIQALTMAGMEAIGIPLNHLRVHKAQFSDFQMLVLPGGFSYADSLGAGKLLGLDLVTYFEEEISAFVASGKPVIGICNGFQALIKSGILPGLSEGQTTLTFNARGHFECRWVYLRPLSQKCIWTRGLEEIITCPIAHGEGNFQTNALLAPDQIALKYSEEDGSPANGEYPLNPNGSVGDVAGICNIQGNVLGLMPHPENHLYAWQHLRHTRGEKHGSGLKLFENGANYARQF